MCIRDSQRSVPMVVSKMLAHNFTFLHWHHVPINFNISMCPLDRWETWDPPVLGPAKMGGSLIDFRRSLKCWVYPNQWGPNHSSGSETLPPKIWKIDPGENLVWRFFQRFWARFPDFEGSKKGPETFFWIAELASFKMRQKSAFFFGRIAISRPFRSWKLTEIGPMRTWLWMSFFSISLKWSQDDPSRSC